jgi:hypothetical protein
LRARSTLSSWPMTFLVRVTRSSFSREVWDILLAYPRGVWYQRETRDRNGIQHNRARSCLISTSTCPGGVHRIVIDRLLPSQGHIPPQQQLNGETNMFRHANGVSWAHKIPSPNGSRRPFLRDFLSEREDDRCVRRNYANLVVSCLGAPHELNLPAGLEVTR